MDAGYCLARLVGDRTSQRALVQAFGRVPERQRVAVWLIDVEGLSSQEVGRVLETSPPNAARLARRGRARLRAEYLSAREFCERARRGGVRETPAE